MAKIDHKGLRTWIEIDTKALKHNYEVFRKIISKQTKLCAVVKSNAYGHGLVDYSKAMEKLGVDMLAVDSIVEGVRLREEGITIPILVLGYTLPENFAEAAKHDIAISISSLSSLKLLAKEKSIKIKVHIKIDSGMHRQGFLPDDAEDVLSVLLAHKEKIITEGLYTHFASAKNPELPNDTQEQIEVFEEWVNIFKDAGFTPLVHAAATGGTLLYPNAHYDMVRIGIGLYGYWPSLEAKQFKGGEITLKPALTWKSIIAEVKSLPAGSSTGYDFISTLHRDSIIAIVPVGYWHGFPRSLSAIGAVIVNHKPAFVLGRVSMDMVVVDVTDVDGKVGDEVTLLGTESPLINPEYVGMLAETTDYELLTRLNPLIKKFYL